MAVYFVATVMLLFYTGAIPVKLACLGKICQNGGFGIGLAIFENRFALRSAERRMDSFKKPSKLKLNLRIVAAFWHALKYALKHLKVEGLSVQGRLGLPDAAQTALVCGSAGILSSALPNLVHVSIQPDFSGNSDLQLCGMVSLRAGHIMLAALIGAWKYISGGNKDGKTSH